MSCDTDARHKIYRDHLKSTQVNAIPLPVVSAIVHKDSLLTLHFRPPIRPRCPSLGP